MHKFLRSILAIFFALSLGSATMQPHAIAQTPVPMRIALVGLVHGHTAGLLKFLPTHPEVTLVGIAEPDATLREKYKALFHLPDNLFYTSEAEMLDRTHPEAILVYTSPLAHRAAVEMAARHHVASMVEKPFSTTLDDALAMQRASQEYHVPVLVNYATTWFPSNIEAANILASGKIGDLRKIVVHDGHRGPKETGVSPEFFRWLTDPVENGAGALFDFGCYGVDLSTWLMHGELPLTVTAITLHIKPEIYPKVDDDSTILLTYPHTQAIIQGSWNWPYDRKDMEVYGATGYVDTLKRDKVRVRLIGETDETLKPAKPLTAPQNDPLSYLAAVLHGQIQDQNDLSGTETNVKVMRILEAARESARTGRTVTMTP
jgi:glucose-fructose oxidoreductase